jgi:hypothetical protein
MGKRGNDKPLTVSVAGGVLRIEIGVSTLAFATLHSQYVYDMMPGRHRHDEREVAKRFSIPDEKGFAEEIRSALLDEEEDGSSLLTELLDKAAQVAIEDGSLCFIDAKDEP